MQLKDNRTICCNLAFTVAAWEPHLGIFLLHENILILADLDVGQPDILVSLESLVMRSKTFLHKLSVKYFPFKAR